jgi:hypothetical protein
MAKRITGKILNEAWQVGAKHALYREDGKWYHQLRDFPGRCLTVTAIFCSQRKMSMRNARMYRFNRMSIYLMAFHQFQDMSVSSHSRNNSLEHFWYPN